MEDASSPESARPWTSVEEEKTDEEEEASDGVEATEETDEA
jgi:hypothetical protein